MTDLSTRYLGLSLRAPLVASSCPLTGNLESLKRLEAAGAGAVVLPSIFEEELEHEGAQLDAMARYGAESFAEATFGYMQVPELERPLLDDRLELVRKSKAALSIPVIGSLNGASPGGWIEYGQRLVEAGVDALELNIYSVPSDPALDSVQVEASYIELVQAVKKAVSVPLAVKCSPFFSAPLHMARRLIEAGAGGLVLFNRFYQPDIDLETLAVVPDLKLSTSEEVRLPLRWIAIMRAHLQASLAATGGAHTWADALKLLLAGADAVMMASALLKQGPGASDRGHRQDEGLARRARV